MTLTDIGNQMHQWATDLFPINRSITGEGVRETLEYLAKIVPELKVHSVKSGTQAFDWKVPQEWHIHSARITNPAGKSIVDFEENNLHVVGYSEPVDAVVDKEELESHLYSLPDQPDAIPYVTSYYKARWGFCLPHRIREELPAGNYHVHIDSRLFDGILNYGEIIIRGASKQEVFLSTYICHPSMANNELSGPVVTIALAKWLLSQPNLKYSYRIVFIPETIGSIVYLSKNISEMKNRIFAGFNITCVGDERAYSFLPSRHGSTLSDLVAKHVLKHRVDEFDTYDWLDRGSDERQYCAPGVDLPVASIMRSKYGTYPEYHTSLDDLSLVTPTGLAGGYDVLRDALLIIENNQCFVTMVLGEPQMGKRDLYPDISIKREANEARLLLDILSYSDGRSLLEIADALGKYALDIVPLVHRLVAAGLMRPVHGSSVQIE